MNDRKKGPSALFPENEKLLDDIGWQILKELQEDARLSFAELGRRVGLSSPAVMERVRKLEEAGVITGYQAQLDVTKLGLPIMAFVRLANVGSRESQVFKAIEDMAEVLECHHVVGEDCYFVKVSATSIGHLEEILKRFSSFTQTTTSIVLSSPIQKRVIEQQILNGDSP